MNTQDATPLIAMKGIYKVFGTVEALTDVYFNIYPSEIVGLIGDNGAGKSTLINILSGIYTPTRGQILVDGNEVTLRSYKDSTKAGLETIYQSSAVVDSMDTTRNIFPFTAGRKAFRGSETSRCYCESCLL
jgi:simple sugar transport system ATP-binding protein